jgi:coenzyme F430 synthetase
MRILVLDTIHGGRAIGEAYAGKGNHVDCVDVYRGEGKPDVTMALTRTYDLVVAPCHLDPDHPLLHFSPAPVISHHEAVRQLLGEKTPLPMIEITGARGKTTTAHALASLMGGKGILHSSIGTCQFPEMKWLSKSSITPGSVLAAAKMASEIRGWLIVEESLGITCAGTMGIITSDEDYFFAAGKKSALAAKIASACHCKFLLVGKEITAECSGRLVHLEDVATCEGTECSLSVDGKNCKFSNPLLANKGYRSSLMLAAAAAMVLGKDPLSLSSFQAIPGRMSVSYDKGVLVIDNANSGTNLETTLEAARYARSVSGKEAITLVIGQAEGDGAVCEGFALSHIQAAIDQIRPAHVVGVGATPVPETPEFDRLSPHLSAYTTTLAEAYSLALQMTDHGSIVLAVKTWR